MLPGRPSAGLSLSPRTLVMMSGAVSKISSPAAMARRITPGTGRSRSNGFIGPRAEERHGRGIEWRARRITAQGIIDTGEILLSREPPRPAVCPAPRQPAGTPVERLGGIESELERHDLSELRI